MIIFLKLHLYAIRRYVLVTQGSKPYFYLQNRTVLLRGRNCSHVMVEIPSGFVISKISLLVMLLLILPLDNYFVYVNWVRLPPNDAGACTE